MLNVNDLFLYTSDCGVGGFDFFSQSLWMKHDEPLKSHTHRHLGDPVWKPIYSGSSRALLLSTTVHPFFVVRVESTAGFLASNWQVSSSETANDGQY